MLGTVREPLHYMRLAAKDRWTSLGILLVSVDAQYPTRIAWVTLLCTWLYISKVKCLWLKSSFQGLTVAQLVNVRTKMAKHHFIIAAVMVGYMLLGHWWNSMAVTQIVETDGITLHFMKLAEWIGLMLCNSYFLPEELTHGAETLQIKHHYSYPRTT